MDTLTQLPPPAPDSAAMFIRPDHEQRMEHMRARTAFLFDDPELADELFDYYNDLSLDPEYEEDEPDPYEEGGDDD